VQRFGRLDGAVNMAGVLGPSSPITDITNDQMDFVLSVNLNGVFNCLRAQLGVMESGSIVRSPSSRR
jgi:NAD(P)-dependent dehydrogenase (short-subunit alcohol dehydrogenase family)